MDDEVHRGHVFKANHKLCEGHGIIVTPLLSIEPSLPVVFVLYLHLRYCLQVVIGPAGSREDQDQV